MRPRLPLHTNTNQHCARTDVHTITQLHMFSKPNYNTRSTSRFVEVDTFCAIFWQKIFGAHNAHASMWYLQASHTIAFMFNTLWWRKSKIWHRPNTFKSQHLFLDTHEDFAVWNPLLEIWQKSMVYHLCGILANFIDSVLKLFKPCSFWMRGVLEDAMNCHILTPPSFALSLTWNNKLSLREISEEEKINFYQQVGTL